MTFIQQADNLPKRNSQKLVNGLKKIKRRRLYIKQEASERETPQPIKGLLQERLMMNDVLWDESMKISTQHQALVLGRIQKAKNNPDRLMNWDKVSKKLKS